ncbi:MAG: hypothetical protein ACSLFO_05440 [Acidimicrobiales bacterium]
MASSKRRPSKSKRYRQNKAVRDARAARSARAGEATAIARGERAVAPHEADAPDQAGAATGAKTAPGGKRGRSGKRKSPYTVPGQRAVVLAFMFTLVSAATLLLAPIQVPRDVPPDDPRVEEEVEVGDRNDDGTVTIFEDGKLVEEESAATAALVLLAPIAITGAAVWFTKRPQRSTAWSIAMVALAGYVFFVGSYAIISLPSLIALAVGGFQSRRDENKDRVAEIRAQREARKAAKASRGTVIDVAATEVADDDAVDQPTERDA